MTFAENATLKLGGGESNEIASSRHATRTNSNAHSIAS
jgi:hypothetical protein